jgi:hypothetical protein
MAMNSKIFHFFGHQKLRILFVWIQNTEFTKRRKFCVKLCTLFAFLIILKDDFTIHAFLHILQDSGGGGDTSRLDSSLDLSLPVAAESLRMPNSPPKVKT